MAGWKGFSDDDLRQMKQSSPDEDEQKRINLAKRQAMARKSKPPQRERLSPQRSNAAKQVATVGGGDSNAVDPAMKLSQGGKIAKSKYPGSPATNKGIQAELHEDLQEVKGGGGKEGAGTGRTEAEMPVEVKELDEAEVASSELEKVQTFQQQNKRMEEANKYKRALLSRAIEDRRKKAKAESDKLMRVQHELTKLDTLLTADVNIVRDKIELASLEYMDATKRYERAEKEFISAKMDLFEKGDNKEQLTEHLYTMIHQNEVRKAKKLVELMEKLTMEVTEEEMELTMPHIPQLSNFTAVATLHDPHKVKVTSVSEEGNDVPTVPHPSDPSAPAPGADQPIVNDTVSQPQPADNSSVTSDKDTTIKDHNSQQTSDESKKDAEPSSCTYTQSISNSGQTNILSPSSGSGDKKDESVCNDSVKDSVTVISPPIDKPQSIEVNTKQPVQSGHVPPPTPTDTVSEDTVAAPSDGPNAGRGWTLPFS